MEDIEIDGTQINSSRDPPGQRCAYIPAGNYEREAYRLSTFKNFPRHVPIDHRSLASSGFYYTGNKDCVQCFSCGFSVENWQLNDDPTHSRWHGAECKFINGNDLRNVPLGSAGFSSSVRKTKSDVTDASTSDLPSASSFTPVGPASPVQSLPSSSTPEQRPQLNSVPARNDISAAYPCLHPINPHMRARESRLQTFLDHMSSWPAHRITATPQEIAEAGMYFLGERDRVKCWYCNGGLQNWERDHEPWEEHAKWFPQCEFLLHQKGPEFVDSIVARFPDIRMPVLHNPASYSTRNESRPSTSSTSSPQIVDPRKELNEINPHMRARESHLQTYLDNTASWPGHNISATAQVSGGLQNWKNDDSHWKEHTKWLSNPIFPNKSNRQMAESPTKANKPTSDVEEELRQLEDERTCKACRDRPSAVVFLPCGHLACCLECCERRRRCPICKKVVREKIKAKFN